VKKAGAEAVAMAMEKKRKEMGRDILR